MDQSMRARAAERAAMVERQMRDRGVRDERVLAAMAEVPREAFVPDAMAEFAYADIPLPIGESQTISQPYVVAEMLARLEVRPTDRALEVGAGSGYAVAVLSRICAEAYGVERHRSLLDEATARIERLGYGNVHLREAGEELGWPDEAPFDAILVSAGGPNVPASLRDQLAVGGRMVIPVGEHRGLQDLLRVRRVAADEWQEESLGPVSFVPLVGADAWEDDPPGDDPPTDDPPGEDPAGPPTAQQRDRPDRLLDRIGGARLVLVGEAIRGV
jgi:protein-L-isoaspartate(D-aspartate) O-methyltransferase